MMSVLYAWLLSRLEKYPLIDIKYRILTSLNRRRARLHRSCNIHVSSRAGLRSFHFCWIGIDGGFYIGFPPFLCSSLILKFRRRFLYILQHMDINV